MPDTTPLAPLPPATAELAAQHELGALTATFTPKRFGWFIKLCMYMTLAVLFFLFMVPAVVYYRMALRRSPDFNPRQRGKRLHLFEHGMIADSESGEGAVAVRWDRVRIYEKKVQLIINGTPGPVQHTCVAMAPGARVTVTDFYQGGTAWAPAMQRAVLHAQGTTAQKAFLAGEVLNFGEFDLSTAGITYRKQLLPWAQVERLGFGLGIASVMKTGDSTSWARVKVDTVPNLSVFAALVDRYSKP